MSTADLLVSLRIDEGSNLDKLRKQLEALVGKRGEKPPEVQQIKFPKIKRALKFIKERVARITTTVIEPTRAGLKERAGQLLMSMREPGITQQIADKISEGSEEEVEDMARALDLISRGMFTNLDKTSRLVAKIERAIREEKMPTGDAITLLHSIQASMVEMQKEMVKSLKNIDADIVPLLNISNVQQEWIEDNSDILDQLSDKFDALDESDVASIKDIFLKDLGMAERLDEALRELDIENTAKLYLKGGLDQIDEDKINTLFMGWLKAIMSGEMRGQMVIPQGFVNAFRKFLPRNFRTGFAKNFGQLDIFIIKAKEDILANLLNISESLAEKFTSLSNLELKSLASKEDVGRMAKYLEFIDPEKMAVVFQGATRDFEQTLSQLSTEITQIKTSIVGLLERAGIPFEKQEQDELEETIKTASEEQTSVAERNLEVAIRLLREVGKTEDDIWDKVQDIADEVEEKGVPPVEVKD